MAACRLNGPVVGRLRCCCCSGHSVSASMPRRRRFPAGHLLERLFAELAAAVVQAMASCCSCHSVGQLDAALLQPRQQLLVIQAMLLCKWEGSGKVVTLR